MRWKQGWRARQTDFHLDHVHPLLIRYWATLGLDHEDRVFVPLCGKSLDLMWLRGLGHDVTGVEPGLIAIRDLFKAGHLQPKRHHLRNDLTCWTQKRLLIYCGDFFELTREDLAGVRAVYDRAALGALPEDLREDYIAHQSGWFAAFVPNNRASARPTASCHSPRPSSLNQYVATYFRDFAALA